MSAELDAWMRGEWTKQQQLAIDIAESLHRHIKVRWWQHKPSKLDLVPLAAQVAADLILRGES